jgi:hypothetical protein
MWRRPFFFEGDAMSTLSTRHMPPARNLQPRRLRAHLWARERFSHYVEPGWVARRLFDVEHFDGGLHDPACGFGRIVQAAWEIGLDATGADIVDRGFGDTGIDFLTDTTPRTNICCNPPFNIVRKFIAHALEVTTGKVAAIMPVPRLNAAHWLQDTPLARVWLLTPRPSMPPGHVIARGEKPGGGKEDFAWLVWIRDYAGSPRLGWLHRDGDLP